MKIAVIINPLPKTNLSPAISVGKLLSILPQESEVFFYGIGYKPSLLPKTCSNLYPVCIEPIKNISDFINKQKNICNQLLAIQPDVVLFWIADKMFKVMHFCKKQKIPTIMWVYGNTFRFINNKIKKTISKLIFIKMLKEASYLAEEHPGVMNLLSEIDIKNRFTKKCTFRFLSIYCDYPVLASYEKMNRQNNRFLVVSRLAKEKNIDLIIQAFINLFNNNNNVTLEIVGSGPVEVELKNRFSCFDNVIFSGWREKDYIANALACSDCFVSASSSEGFPSSIQEAIKTKNLIVSYPVGGLTSFLTHQNSIIINSISIESIQEAILKAHNVSSKEKITMLEKALQDLDADFSFSSCKNKMRETLEYVIKRNDENGKECKRRSD